MTILIGIRTSKGTLYSFVIVNRYWIVQEQCACGITAGLKQASLDVILGIMSAKLTSLKLLFSLYWEWFILLNYAKKDLVLTNKSI